MPSENKALKLVNQFVNSYLLEPVKKSYEWVKVRGIVKVILLAVLTNYVIESLARKSPLTGLWHMVSNPVVFFYNALIIFFTLLFSIFFPKRKAVCIIIDILWLALGIINGILLSYRITPLAAVDFTLIMSVKTIFDAYITVFQGVLIVIGALAIIAVIVLLVIKSKSQKVEWKKGIISVILAGSLVAGSGAINTAAGTLSDEFVKLPDAYSDYGFVYCFIVGLFNWGISRPEDYSEEKIDDIADLIEGDTTERIEKANIIMLQMESFIDASYMKYMTFSEDPTPVFTELKKNYPMGFLEVPSIGAGTANTEFEVITGMNLDYFGAGEYPYKTILHETTCESACYNLKELGYSTHAIHNNEGTFYGRNEVFSNLGFDTFTPMEYMYDLEYSPTGWAKDEILTDYIIGAMESTETRDYVYAISVQGHGKYPSAALDDYDTIVAIEGIEDSRLHHGFTYYVNQLREMDTFVGELLAILEDYEEPTVVVVYGDHLPNFTIEETEMSNGNLFQTEYVIWSNFGLEAEDRDLESYQLTAHVFEALGIHNGNITKLHQECAEMPEYQEMLEMLEYDMLYGDKTIYDGVNPYEPTDIQMGLSEIYVDGVRIIEDDAYIFGDMFNEFSIVCINGERVGTAYLDRNVLRIADNKLENGCSITVIQAGDDREELGCSEEFTYVEGVQDTRVPEKIYGDYE